MKEQIKRWLPLAVRARGRAVQYRARLTARRLVPGTRLRPALLIVGAMKGGTSSLFMGLVQHPGVAAPLVKEVRYFDLNWHRPASWYWRHFPLAAAARGRATLDASPGYLPHPRAPRRARSLVPGAGIVVLVRHPVERAVSHYFHQRLVGSERRPIDEALEAPESDPPDFDPRSNPDRHAFRRYLQTAYVGRGRYAPQIARWMEVFGRDRVLVLFSEDFFADPRTALGRIAEFAGWPAHPIDVQRIYNQGRKLPFDPAVAARLWDRYDASNRALEELLGRTLPWTAPPASRTLR